MAKSEHSGRAEETSDPRPLPRRDFVRLMGGGAVGACLASCPGSKGKQVQAGASTSSDRRSGRSKPQAAGGKARGAARAAGDKPNIILFFSDDLGYADVGYHGSEDLLTPHIDSLARGGVKLSDAYVSAPLCSPSRAGLLTGRYQQRFGHEYNTRKPKPQQKLDVGLPVAEMTLAQALKDAGYTTGIMGKWHQGLLPKYHPQKRGFDEFFGFLGGGHSYTKLKPRGDNPIYRGTKPVAEKEYLTDAISREAVAFVERYQDKPFFLYVSYNAPHAPLQAPKKYLKRFADIADKDRRTYAAMVSAMDDGIGRVISAVKEAGLTDNTIFMFLNDNGSPAAGVGDNAPLRGFKYSVYEGGIRVPWTIRWQGRLPAGKTYQKPVISLDIFATAVAAAGAQLPADRQLDGVNLLPYLEGSKAGSPHEVLCWRVGDKTAVRKGNYKLLSQGDGPYELYDLEKDRSEQHDLAADKPKLRAELAKQLEQWSSELAKPLWGPKGKNKGKGKG